MDNAEGAKETVDKKKTKRDKVRSAWISFAGRIVAQMVGAIATVALGVMVLHRYTSTDTRPTGHPNAAVALGAPSAGALGYATYPQPAATGGAQGERPIVIVLSPGNCAAALDTPATSAAHLDNGTFLPR